MAAAYVEHRPHASSEHVATSHYVVIVDESLVGGNLPPRRTQRNMHAMKVTVRCTWPDSATYRTGLNLPTGELTLVNIRVIKILAV
jgi:hypothetical protein